MGHLGYMPVPTSTSQQFNNFFQFTSRSLELHKSEGRLCVAAYQEFCVLYDSSSAAVTDINNPQQLQWSVLQQLSIQSVNWGHTEYSLRRSLKPHKSDGRQCGCLSNRDLCSNTQLFLFPSLMAILFPSPFPHYKNFFPHPPPPTRLFPFPAPFPRTLLLISIYPCQKKIDLQLICTVLNKSAKLQTHKCNNILSKIQNSNISRTCHQMHCELVTKQQTVNWVGP